MKGLLRGGLVMLLLLSSVWVIFAASGEYSAKQIFNNEFETSGVDVEIKQFQKTKDGIVEAEEDLPVKPGQTVSYIPRVTNLKTDSFVRVNLQLRDDPGGKDALQESCFGETGPDWIKRGEWYYCTEALAEGQSKDLLETMRIPDEMNSETGTLKVWARVDAVQAKNFSPDFNSLHPWGSVEIQEAKKGGNGESPARLAKPLKNPDFSYAREGVFECSTEDLFSNFDIFQPGDSCREKLTMKNDSQDTMEVFFRTENLENELLREMKLSLSSNGRTVYSGTLASPELETFMKIAAIAPGSEGELNFEITMPSEADNGYSLLKDNVTWIIAVKKGDSSPETGDAITLIMMAVLAALTALALAVVVIISGRLRK